MLPITQNMQIMQILQIFARNALSADAYPHCLALPVSLCIALPALPALPALSKHLFNASLKSRRK